MQAKERDKLILVAGATGYVGRRLVKALEVSSRYRVRCLARKPEVLGSWRRGSRLCGPLAMS